ncbi:hypothetical protein Bca101_056672 [Brassica carinata]
MTLVVIAPPPSRSRPPPDPPSCKFPLLGPFEPLEPSDPPNPPDVSPVPVLRRFIFASPYRRLSSAFHLVGTLSFCSTWLVNEFLMLLGFLTSFAVASCKRWGRCRFQVLGIMVLTCSPPPSILTVLTSDMFHEACALPLPRRSPRNLR